MYYKLISFFILFSCGNLNAQDYLKCSVYQFIGDDSLNMFLSKEIRYNDSGKILTEKIHQFNTKRYWGTIPKELLYIYDNDRVVKLKVTDKDSTKSIVNFQYKDSLIKKERYYKSELRAVMNPFVRKGNGRKNGCLVDDNDYFRYRLWFRDGIVKYGYSDEGILRIEHRKNKGLFCKYGYVKIYDSIGQIQEHYSFVGRYVKSVKSFEYSEEGYVSTEQFYMNNNQPMYKVDSCGNIPNEIINHSFNKEKTIESVSIMSANGDFWGREIIFYDKKGVILKRLQYDRNNKPELTTIFMYD